MEPLALEKCASGLLTLQNLLPRSWGWLTHKCQRVPSAHPTQPAWQTHCFSRGPHHLRNTKSPQTSLSDCKIILEVALFHGAGTPGQPSLPAVCPAAPVLPRRALVPPGTLLWHRHIARDGVISPLSINPTGLGSPWLFPVFPRLPAQCYHSADKGSLWFPWLSAALCHPAPGLV